MKDPFFAIALPNVRLYVSKELDFAERGFAPAYEVISLNVSMTGSMW